MASLIVRNLEDEIYERLRLRAAEHGLSMEEEVRKILTRAVMGSERLGDLALDCFGDDGVELEFPHRGPHDPMAIE